MALHGLTGLPPPDPPSAQLERDDFAKPLARVFKLPRPKADDWKELLWHLAERVKGGNAILIRDEINWMGRSDAQFPSKLWALWEAARTNSPLSKVGSWRRGFLLSSAGSSPARVNSSSLA